MARVRLNDATASPCGWLRVWDGDALVHDAALPTEFEAACAAALDAVRGHAWSDTLPLFDTLEIAIATTGIERRLPFGEETIDTFEALHEDCYYGALEFFKARAGLDDADRTLQPGHIVPLISRSEDDTRVTVRLAAHRRVDPPVDTALVLDSADRSLAPVEVEAAMQRLPGERFGVTSFQGRPVAGLHVRGTLPGLVVTAGQHANESSGVVGALRAAPLLNALPGAHYALVALENPTARRCITGSKRPTPRTWRMPRATPRWATTSRRARSRRSARRRRGSRRSRAPARACT